MTIFEELFSLAGKTALVTGGASGIGRMAASAMVRAGAHVMIASRRGDQCAAVAKELNALDAAGSAEGFAGDVGSEEGVTQLAAAVSERTDKLHILFNNAGASWGERLESFPYHAWARVLNINVTGLFHLTRELLPLLEKAAGEEDPARVVNLGSVMGSQPIADGAYSYTASKAAVHHLTRTLANEFAAKRVTVNALAPGPFQSRMTAFATGTEEKAAKVGARVPLGRIGAPDDIAGATLYLCGRAGSYVTGAILPIDGGQSAQHGMKLFRD
ncbi:SDR family oxidoreductase [Chelativorans salis]|uniref:SDR family oxidoreductase n=1 Tax=Chelativorans salis TaxID=2978478 RepID=A0ABT2LSK5_9HYPH|nr:SDR family oxidoreductase [Chelativorans sp. EGI FJ00035]MCT7377495.1 SDR family oxidoreductase [Chelativorans sp. EGI FJ00035]